MKQIPSPTPAQPVDQATALLDLMLRLADLMVHETALLRSGRVQDIGPLQREKLRLTGLYHAAVKAVEAGGARITMLPPALRTQLVAASTRLAEVATDNERALRIGRAATRHLLDMVVESVKTQLKPLSRYNAKLAPVRRAPALAVALDRRM